MKTISENKLIKVIDEITKFEESNGVYRDEINLSDLINAIQSLPDESKAEMVFY